jgi:hypothetical protein
MACLDASVVVATLFTKAHGLAMAEIGAEGVEGNGAATLILRVPVAQARAHNEAGGVGARRGTLTRC